MNKYTV